MRKYFNFLINAGIHNYNDELENQRIRFANAIATIHFVFIVLIFSLLLYQYGFKTGAKLVLISTIIPVFSIVLNQWRKYSVARYWISLIIPLAIIAISIITKRNNPVGFTGFYEFFDTRMLLLVSAIIPLIIFPRRPLSYVLVGLLPSGLLLFLYDPIHTLFSVGFDDLFEDAKQGYYIAGIMFDVSYIFAVLGVLSLKNLNEKLVEDNSVLIENLNSKTKLQEKLLLRKQDLLSQNKEVSENLLKKQKQILNNQKELETAANLISVQKNELQFKNIELNSKVDERTRELKKANEELVIQNNGLLQFSNTVSHNLRAPVASLIGLVRLFEIEEDQANQKEMLSHIKDSSMALDGVISDLNKVVDIRNQLLHLKENINLNDEISKIKQLLGTTVNELGVSIQTKFEFDNIFFIRSYLHSILYNLINNAIKYSKPEGENLISVKSYQEKNKICIEVADKGLGIDLVKFGNDLFKMHKRFHDHVDGKGLGLYLVKQQVEAMNGTIDVKSELGEGTRFLMKFPIPEEVHFQEYYSSSFATVAYDAKLKSSMLIWHKPPHSNEYRDVLSANKEMFANYNATNWLIDVRNVGIISVEDRTWFASTVMGEIINRGCNTMVVVKNEDDGKDFSYWQKMIDISNKMGVKFNLLFDYDQAIKYLQKKELSLQA